MLLPAAILIGCGTGEYEKRFDARKKELRQGSQFDRELGPPVELSGTPFLIRVPSAFKDPLPEKSADGQGAIDPSRLELPGVSMSGSKRVYEATIEDSKGGKLPYYCCIFASPTAGANQRDLAPVWLNQVKVAFPEFDGQWNRVDVSTPEGRATSWQVLRVEGKQKFAYLEKDGNEIVVTMPGTLVLYHTQEAGHYLTVAWRMPASIEDTSGLARLEKLVPGAIRAK